MICRCSCAGEREPFPLRLQTLGCSGDAPWEQQRTVLFQHGTLLPCGIQPGHDGVQWGAVGCSWARAVPGRAAAPPCSAAQRPFYNTAQRKLKCTGNNSTIKRIQLCLFAFKLTLGMK